MNEKKPVNKAVVLITCLCAVVWNSNLFWDLAYGYTNTVSFVLHIVCAVIWDLCAAVWLLRYRSAKKDSAD